MSPAVVVSPDAPVARARRAAEEAGVRQVAVRDPRRLLGVVEEDGLWVAAEDVLRTAAGLQGSLSAREDWTVRQVMRPPTPVVSPSESLQTAARLMLLKHRSALPVLREGELVGLLAVDDIRRAVGAPVVVADASTADAGQPPAPEADDGSPGGSQAHVA